MSEKPQGGFFKLTL